MLHKILVPLDGSKLAEKALPYAQSLAEKYEAELILVWVLQPYPPPVAVDYGGVTTPIAIDAIMTQAEDEATKYLAQLQDKYRQQSIPTRTFVLKGYSIADAIIDLARQEHADVIVKTTHGRSGLSRLLLGNVAAQVLQHAPCPVFLVRVSSHDKDAPAGD